MELRVFATSLVEHVALCLRSGEINVSTLRIVNKDRDRFLELFSLLPEVPENISLKEEVPAGIEASGNQRETAVWSSFLKCALRSSKLLRRKETLFLLSFTCVLLSNQVYY